MRRRLLLATLAFALGLLTAAPAQALDKAIWGPLQLNDGRSAFPVYHQLGVDVYQMQLSWAAVAPTAPRDGRNPRDPAYRWPAEVDRAIREAWRYRIRVALMVRGSPAWANGGRDPRWAPLRTRYYARFLTAASRRYPNLRDWMIWGEPSRGANFQPLPPDRPTGPRAYALLLDDAYVALKQRNRRNRVIGGMTFSYGDVYPAKWIRWMRLPNGRPPRMDLYGHNPFSGRLPDVRKRPVYRNSRDMSDVDTLAADVRSAYLRSWPQYRRRVPGLWLSEFTVSSDHPNRAFAFAVSRREQARWLSAAYGIAARQREVAGLGWFNLQDEPPSVPGALTLGLLTWDGKRKPAFDAYRRVR